jgi:hypothetical protein
MKPHPAAEAFPMMDDARFAELKADIETHDLLQPITTYEDMILDGRNRHKACLELVAERGDPRFEPRFEPYQGTTPWCFVWSSNAQRRDLKSDQQRAAIFIKEFKAKIAQELKTKIETEAKAKHSEAAKEQHKVSNPRAGEKKSVGGQKVPANKSHTSDDHPMRKALANIAGVNPSTMKQQETLRQHRPDLADKVAAGKVSPTTAKKQFDRQRRAEKVAKAAEEAKLDSDRVTLHLGTCFSLTKLVPRESVDWIITDPPYPENFLDCFKELVEVSAHALKPGGSLLCMSGQTYLPTVIAALDKCLTYQWTIAYLTPGGQAVQIFPRRVNTFWKPILWFVKDEYKGDWIGDVAKSNVNDNDKTRHHWGQSESGMYDLMRRFVRPGAKSWSIRSWVLAPRVRSHSPWVPSSSASILMSKSLRKPRQDLLGQT